MNINPLKGGSSEFGTNNSVLGATSQVSNELGEANKAALNVGSQANNLIPKVDTSNLTATSEIENVFKDVIGSAVAIGSLATTLEVEALGTEAVVVTEAAAKAAAKAAEAATKAAAKATRVVSDTIQTEAPQVIDSVKKLATVWYDLQATLQEAAVKLDVDALKIAEQSKTDQIQILMTNGLSKDQANAKLEEIEKKEERKKERDEKEREREEKNATMLELATINANAIKTQDGGSRKRNTLSQIQKGGRQSAKRTQKSINDFFNSSVTSSQILKMVTKNGDKPRDKHKRKTKVKRRRFGKKSRKRQ
jgi:hypothetical protein